MLTERLVVKLKPSADAVCREGDQWPNAESSSGAPLGSLAHACATNSPQTAGWCRRSAARGADAMWDDPTAILRLVDGADAVIGLSGKSVDCRYNDANRTEILRSRVDTTRALAAAIAASERPPAVWLNASTATIYRHAMDRPQTESTGELGSGFSVDIARNWEREFLTPELLSTRRGRAQDRNRARRRPRHKHAAPPRSARRWRAANRRAMVPTPPLPGHRTRPLHAQGARLAPDARAAAVQLGARRRCCRGGPVCARKRFALWPGERRVAGRERQPHDDADDAPHRRCLVWAPGVSVDA